MSEKDSKSIIPELNLEIDAEEDIRIDSQASESQKSNNMKNKTFYDVFKSV